MSDAGNKGISTTALALHERPKAWALRLFAVNWFVSITLFKIMDKKEVEFADES